MHDRESAYRACTKAPRTCSVGRNTSQASPGTESQLAKQKNISAINSNRSLYLKRPTIFRWRIRWWHSPPSIIINLGAKRERCFLNSHEQHDWCGVRPFNLFYTLKIHLTWIHSTPTSKSWTFGTLIRPLRLLNALGEVDRQKTSCQISIGKRQKRAEIYFVRKRIFSEIALWKMKNALHIS